jgi:hypothetical protein
MGGLLPSPWQQNLTATSSDDGRSVGIARLAMPEPAELVYQGALLQLFVRPAVIRKVGRHPKVDLAKQNDTEENPLKHVRHSRLAYSGKPPAGGRGWGRNWGQIPHPRHVAALASLVGVGVPKRLNG